MQDTAGERQYGVALARIARLALGCGLGLAAGVFAAFAFCARIGWW